MAPEDWERIKQVFSAAMGVPTDRRDAFLLEACADRPGLRDAVAELLAAHDEASSTFLEAGSLLFDAPWLFRPADQVAGRFRVVRSIARGAMGEVYEAYDDRLRLSVALKAIRPQLVGDAQTSERFRREVLVTRNIAHDGLCRVFDLIEHRVGAASSLPEGTVVPCLTMQLLEGASLEDCLQTDRPMTPAAALPLLRQIAEALDVLHDHGVVHRDLKPSNVMLIPRGAGRQAVLTDFGLAKPLDESLFETQTTVHGGAPFFMAPELFKGDRPSRASDIYAFGLLIDEMVTKARAFTADSLHGLMMQKLQDGPLAPSQRSDGLPDAWEQTILRCLDRDPAQRFHRATDACAALERQQKKWGRRALHNPSGGRTHRLKYAALAGVTAVALTGVVITKDPVQRAGSQSVVVLPFANLTGDPENDYLSAGTAGELGRRLSRLGGLLVHAPRDPANPIDPSRLATYTLRGHVQQSGSTLRITVQLADTRQDTLLWSQNFEGPRSRALQLEDALAEEAAAALTRAAATPGRSRSLRSLAALLGITPSFGRVAEAAGFGTTNNAAFDAYIRGRYLFEERTLPSALAATTFLTRATELDPTFAAPNATLADLQALLMDLHYAPHKELLQKAEEYATRAVSLDPNLPDAQLSLAAVRQMQSRWTEAEASFRRALELHPTFARAHRWFGGMLLQFGRFDESLKLMERALELDPYDFPSQSAYGLALFYAGRPLEAASHLERIVARRDLLHPHLILGQVYALLGGTEGARRDEFLRQAVDQSKILRQKEIEASRAISGGSGAPRTDYADFVGALAWAYRQDAESARPFVERLEAGRAAGSVAPSFLARVYAVQGRTDDALQALEDSEGQRDRELMYLSVSPLYARVRNDPRFRALEERMQLVR